MRAGLIARAEDRGLGHITWAASQALPWDRVAVIDYEPRNTAVPNHLDRYPDATRLWCDIWTTGRLDETAARAWLDGLDVVYSAETLYDWRLADWARDAGVATVVHGMPEYWRHAMNRRWPQPTRWWWPTPWRLDHLPAGPVVPIPVEAMAPMNRPADDGELTVVHTLGHRCQHDRNGTNALARALRRVSIDVTVRVYTQERTLDLGPVPGNVNLRVHCGGVDDRFDMFAGAHLLMMPRRYGGLCLPVQEAMSVGVAASMPAITANGWWPVDLFDAAPLGQLQMPGGVVETAGVRAEPIAAAIDRLGTDRAELGALQDRAWEWGQANTWDALADVWWSALDDATLPT